MKRDLDLIRAILLAVREAPTVRKEIKLNLPPHDKQTIAYHVLLLKQAGYLEAINFSSHEGMDYRPTHLTWAGHDFIEAASDDKRWNAAKSIVAAAGGFTLEVLKSVLVDLLKQQMTKLGPG